MLDQGNLSGYLICGLFQQSVEMGISHRDNTNYAPGETAPPEGAVPERVNSPSCAQGSVRYSARFHRFLFLSSNFSIATAMLC